jgi:hypothetical protein
VAVTTTTAIHQVPPSGESARTLDRIVETAEQISGIRVDDVQPGDWVVVRTKNSKYSLAVVGDGAYRVSGGWFAANKEEERDVRIAGCTWGGAVIHTRLVAAVGMFLEFDNGVRTTRIHEITLIRGGDDRTH